MAMAHSAKPQRTLGMTPGNPNFGILCRVLSLYAQYASKNFVCH